MSTLDIFLIKKFMWYLKNYLKNKKMMRKIKH